MKDWWFPALIGVFIGGAVSLYLCTGAKKEQVVAPAPAPAMSVEACVALCAPDPVSEYARSYDNAVTCRCERPRR